MAVIQPKVRGFICVTAHPEGCRKNIEQQIEYIRSQGPIQSGPKNVLVIGGSTGYGLSSAIAAALGCGAATYRVFFERPAADGKPASPGFYNSVAFDDAARSAGLYTQSFNGDAFSHAVKKQVINQIKNEMGPIDLLVYSLASPKRVDPDTGDVYKSVLKPIGQSFTGKTLDTDKALVTDISIQPASEEEIQHTIKVMGGEDWELWMDMLEKENLIAKGCTTVAYSYIGPEVTWAIYKDGTIGKAKEHLESSANRMNHNLAEKFGGRAFVSVNKALVTQASSAIPVVPLYISFLFKIMKEKGTHEGCIEQAYRLFAERLYNGANPQVDSARRIRIDDLEMAPEIQSWIQNNWKIVNTENLNQLTDFKAYQDEFLKLFGFNYPSVDYDADVDL